MTSLLRNREFAFAVQQVARSNIKALPVPLRTLPQRNRKHGRRQRAKFNLR